jgi:hypothetical protein
MTEIEPEIRRIIDATGLTPSKIAFVKTGKTMFAIDRYKDGIRVIYSDAFLEEIRSVPR